MRHGAEIAVIIPAFNEEQSIGRVVAGVPAWIDDIIVVDNGSTDDTPKRAREAGARLVREPRRGYGSACRAGIRSLRRPEIVVFMDGDASDSPEEMTLLTDPILTGEADLVSGSRTLGKRERGALPPQARFGNWLACRLIKLFWNVRYTDLGPYRAIRRSSLQRLGMCDRTFGWTVEMQIKAATRGLRIREVPVSYRRRIGKSKISGTLRGTLGAGCKILYTIFKAAAMELPTCRSSFNRQRVIIFSRFPLPGQVKTRLIPVLGPEGAANLQRKMTEQTWAEVLKLASSDQCNAELRYEGGDIASVLDWLGDGHLVRHQGEGDLGKRMSAAFEQAFKEGMERAVIVGSDCPGLTAGHITRAFAGLRSRELVIGPAGDGGYYLIGLAKPLPTLFEGISWGTEKVLEQTLQRASTMGISPLLLDVLDDVDRPEDLARCDPPGTQIAGVKTPQSKE